MYCLISVCSVQASRLEAVWVYSSCTCMSTIHTPKIGPPPLQNTAALDVATTDRPRRMTLPRPLYLKSTRRTTALFFSSFFYFFYLRQVRDLAHAAAAQAAQAAALHAVSKGAAGPDGGGARGGGAGSGGVGAGRGGGLVPGAGLVPRPGRGAAGLVPGRGRGRPRKIKKDRKEQHEGDDETAKHMQILKKLLNGPGADSASEGRPKVREGGGGFSSVVFSLLLFVLCTCAICAAASSLCCSGNERGRRAWGSCVLLLSVRACVGR